MRAFLFSYDGSWLGGEIVVVAKTEEEAALVAAKSVSDQDAKTLKLSETIHLPRGKATVVYNDDGEY